jgi:Tol biopolymer transport system component
MYNEYDGSETSNCRINDGMPDLYQQLCPVPPSTNIKDKTVPHEGQYGIYTLDLASNDVSLIYGTDKEIYTSALRLNGRGDMLVFAQKVDGNANENVEIFTIGTDGTGLRRLTNNNYWDLYPAWTADDTKIAFLSLRNKDLDIYTMGADGSGQSLLFDSGSHDADIDSKGDIVVFTSGSAIWRIKYDGTGLTRVTSPKNAGQWGSANLPIGDYDPRLNPSDTKVVFERLVNTDSVHGNYDIFTINVDGSGESRLTNTGYSQGLASWSHAGDKIVYVVAAINDQGKYDAYMMNADGTDNHDITPAYFPPDLLIHSPVFSKDDSKIYFIGQWWE